MAEWTAEIVVDAALARRLIEGQFPDLRGAALEFLDTGWDQTVWRVDRRWAFRFPRREIAVPTGRRRIRSAYGPVAEAQLLRARVLAVMLCATLALWARAEGLGALEAEALAGLRRTA